MGITTKDGTNWIYSNKTMKEYDDEIIKIIDKLLSEKPPKNNDELLIMKADIFITISSHLTCYAIKKSLEEIKSKKSD